MFYVCLDQQQHRRCIYLMDIFHIRLNRPLISYLRWQVKDAVNTLVAKMSCVSMTKLRVLSKTCPTAERIVSDVEAEEPSNSVVRVPVAMLLGFFGLVLFLFLSHCCHLRLLQHQ